MKSDFDKIKAILEFVWDQSRDPKNTYREKRIIIAAQAFEVAEIFEKRGVELIGGNFEKTKEYQEELS